MTMGRSRISSGHPISLTYLFHMGCNKEQRFREKNRDLGFLWLIVSFHLESWVAFCLRTSAGWRDHTFSEIHSDRFTNSCVRDNFVQIFSINNCLPLLVASSACWRLKTFFLAYNCCLLVYRGDKFLIQAWIFLNFLKFSSVMNIPGLWPLFELSLCMYQYYFPLLES